MSKVTGPDQIPKNTQYLLLAFKEKVVRHEGDERSRTHPGHGYPAYDERIDNCEVYVALTQDDVLAIADGLHKRGYSMAVVEVARISRATTQMVLGLE